MDENMNAYAILDGFEKSLRTTINSRYLETVNEMNDGFNKLLERALASADTFDTAIRSSVRDIKVKLTSTLEVKDEKYEDTSFHNQAFDQNTNEIPPEKSLDVHNRRTSKNELPQRSSYRERTEALYEPEDKFSDSIENTNFDSLANMDTLPLYDTNEDSNTHEYQPNEQRNNIYDSEVAAHEDLNKVKYKKFDEMEEINTNSPYLEHPFEEKALCDFNDDESVVPSRHRSVENSYKNETNKNTETQNMARKKNGGEIQFRNESERIYQTYVKDSKRGTKEQEEKYEKVPDANYPPYHPNNVDRSNVFYNTNTTSNASFPSPALTSTNQGKPEIMPSRQTHNYKSMGAYNKSKMDFGKQPPNNNIITHSKQLPNGLVSKSYECGICGMNSNFKNNVDLHVKRKHYTEKPFSMPTLLVWIREERLPYHSHNEKSLKWSRFDITAMH